MAFMDLRETAAWKLVRACLVCVFFRSRYKYRRWYIALLRLESYHSQSLSCARNDMFEEYGHVGGRYQSDKYQRHLPRSNAGLNEMLPSGGGKQSFPRFFHLGLKPPEGRIWAKTKAPWKHQGIQGSSSISFHDLFSSRRLLSNNSK